MCFTNFIYHLRFFGNQISNKIVILLIKKYLMISLDNKKISLCIIHNAPINYFCIGQTCAFKRLCC